MLKFKPGVLRSLIVILFIFAQSQLALAEPITLNDTELDRIAAGYVDLEVSAIAIASGPDAVARFSADVEQNIGVVQEDGFIYTTTEGRATAFARGNWVDTSVGYFLNTDEEILSFNVAQKFSSKKVSGKKHKKKHEGSNKKHGSNKKKSNKNKHKKHSSKKKKNKHKKHKRHGKKSGHDKKSKGRKHNKKKSKHAKSSNNKHGKKKRHHSSVTSQKQSLRVSIVTRASGS